MTQREQTQHLRRTVAPYTGQFIILTLATLGMLFVSITKHTWGLALSTPVMWLLFSFLVYIGLKYKISWTDKEVCRKASGGPDVHIRYDQITSVKSENLQAARTSRLIAAVPADRDLCGNSQRP